MQCEYIVSEPYSNKLRRSIKTKTTYVQCLTDLAWIPFIYAFFDKRTSPTIYDRLVFACMINNLNLETAIKDFFRYPEKSIRELNLELSKHSVNNYFKHYFARKSKLSNQEKYNIERYEALLWPYYRPLHELPASWFWDDFNYVSFYLSDEEIRSGISARRLDEIIIEKSIYENITEPYVLCDAISFGFGEMTKTDFTINDDISVAFFDIHDQIGYIESLGWIDCDSHIFVRANYISNMLNFYSRLVNQGHVPKLSVLEKNVMSGISKYQDLFQDFEKWHTYAIYLHEEGHYNYQNDKRDKISPLISKKLIELPKLEDNYRFKELAADYYAFTKLKKIIGSEMAAMALNPWNKSHDHYPFISSIEAYFQKTMETSSYSDSINAGFWKEIVNGMSNLKQL